MKAHTALSGNVSSAELLANQGLHPVSDFSCEFDGLFGVLPPVSGQLMRLLGPVPSQPSVPRQLSADRGGASVKRLCDLFLCVNPAVK